MQPEPKPMKVTLIEWPRHPVGTLWYIWEQSRKRGDLPSPEDAESLVLNANIARERKDEEFQVGGYWKEKYGISTAKEFLSYADQIEKTFNFLLTEGVPVTESLNFTFMLENVPISLREQLVRHRIGARVGPEMGVDMVPDEGSSMFWSQTMRMLPMDDFFSEGHFVVPDTLEGKMTGGVNPRPAETLYMETLMILEDSYTKLVEAGVPREDARNLIPIGATHSITWTLNLKAMSHIFGKRACWVSQFGLWEGVMTGMVDEMVSKVHPIFRNLVQPPCMSKGVYKSCPIEMVNRERISGRDGAPPCPMFVYNQTETAVDEAAKHESPAWTSPPIYANDPPGLNLQQDITQWTVEEGREKERIELLRGMSRFQNLWHLDVFTGQPLEKESVDA